MNLIVSICVLVYGIGSIIASQLGYISASPQTWIQSFIAIAGGLYFSIKYGYPYIGNILTKESVPISLMPTKTEADDLECLIHLRNRLVGHKEGLETVAKLNGIMFTLGIPNEKISHPSNSTNS